MCHESGKTCGPQAQLVTTRKVRHLDIEAQYYHYNSHHHYYFYDDDDGDYD